MPGGGGGGGQPPKKHCPRCGRESLDDLANSLFGLIIGFGAPPIITWLWAFISISERIPPKAQVLAFLIPAVAMVVGAVLAGRAVARRLGWEHECPHCSFKWPLLSGRALHEALRDRVIAGLFAQGWKALAPETGSDEAFRLEGELGGRRAIIVKRRANASAQIALAVSHAGTLTDGERGEVLAAGNRLERTIDDLVPQKLFESLSLGDGELRLALRAFPVAESDMETLLLTLDEAAPAFERVRLEVHGVERRAFARNGLPRCGYCHADLTGQEPDLVACEQCSTVLHEGCWAELGHCPVLGCGGKSHERARER